MSENGDIRQLLNVPPPRECLATRSQSGTTLTYVQGHYIIGKMNEIFGPEGWSRQFTGEGLRMVNVTSEVPKNKTAVRHDVSMLCDYCITAQIGDMSIRIEDVGYGIGQSYSGIGDAYESAAKEAVTDALKRCCRSLGNAMGNCLYDKKWLKALSGQEGAGHDGTSENDMDHNGEQSPDDLF